MIGLLGTLGLPIDASMHGRGVDQLITWIHVLMLVLFVGWGALFVYMLWRYRRKAQPKADYVGVKSHASSYVEGSVLVIELLLLFGFSVPTWASKVDIAAVRDNNPVHVRVVAQQFAWNVHYPGPDGKFGQTRPSLLNEATNPVGLDRKSPGGKDDIVTVNQLHLPVNRPAIIELSTKDVIHSFFLPMFRVKQDTIPGMSIPIYFTPTKTTAQIREEMATTLTLKQLRNRNASIYIPVDDVKDSAGAVLVAKGRTFSTKNLDEMEAAGIGSVRVTFRNPTEIACAQLCGLTHYKMIGYMTVHDEAGYKKWLQDELDYLEE